MFLQCLDAVPLGEETERASARTQSRACAHASHSPHHACASPSVDRILVYGVYYVVIGCIVIIKGVSFNI